MQIFYNPGHHIICNSGYATRQLAGELNKGPSDFYGVYFTKEAKEAEIKI